jgi:putative ABC transport system permease protein
MKSLKRFFARILNFAATRRGDQRLREEMQEHLVLQTEENIRAGMTPVEARRHARMKFGAVEAIREDYHAEEGLPLLENLLHDTRFALRILRKSPGFTLIALVTLALGIGATTALFSVVDAVMLKPLPFPTADRLVRIESLIEATGNGGVASYPDFLDWRARNHVTDGMAAFRTGDFTLIGSREPVHLQGAVVSAQLFSLLGLTPELGRSFLPEEDSPAKAGGVDPVILSYGLWQREFGADVSVLGRTIQLGDHRFTVVGVMPQAFQYPIQAEPIELWTTIAADARGGANAMTAQRGAHYLDVVALLKPNVTLQQAQAEFASIASVLNRQHPENKPRTTRLVPELQLLTGDVRTPLLVLLGAVGCVLLMVCANIANLLLMRATGRRKEMAVRIALGASGRRVTCQLLAESLVLGLLGGALGLALALLSIRFLVRIMPVDIPRLNTIGLDARLLGFALLISLLAGILFGLAPALQASKVDLTESLKKSGRGTGGEDKGRLRATLAVSEIALAVVLLLGAGLLLQSFFRLTRIDPGFNPQHVLTFQLDAPGGTESAQLPGFFREAVARISVLPGVSSASAAASLPLTGDNIGSSVEIEGQPTPMGSRPSTDFNAVEPNYFHTMGTALISGRDFTPQDDLKSTPVAIVNRTLVRLFFSNQNPIGKRVRPGIGNGYGPGETPMREIVGVIEDIKQSRPGAEAAPEIYAPLAQSPFDTMFIAARTANDPASIVQAARQQIISLNKNLPIYHVKTLDQYFADSVAEPRFNSLLLSGFAILAVLLACLGVYGVVSYAVIERTHEIGVRMALGADRSKVVRWILLKGLLLSLAGVTIGLAGSFVLVHLLSSLLFGVRATDPMTFAAATVAVLSVAGLASYIPARRAAKVEPMVALRYE